MPKKTCPNGHVYDTAIYGDQCPMCPSVSQTSASVPMPGATQLDPMLMTGGPNIPPSAGPGAHTHIAGPAQNPGVQGYSGQSADPNAGETRVRPADAVPAAAAAPATPARTVIRRAAGVSVPGQPAVSRRLVGFLVTYNRTPNGKAYNLYEGRNYIGRDPKCDICIPDDDQLSGTHMSVMFRNVDKRFKFRDEQSSNGTFVNKELLDDGELKNYDIIRVGGTIFIFMAIPLLN